MAHIDHTPSKYMLNLLHVLPPFVDKEKGIINVIIEVNQNSRNKYELITESGQLKLDRVGYSSLVYPFSYGAIPMTWDLDNDPLDVEIVGVTEHLAPGSLVEARIIGVMKFVDSDEVDDKIIAVLSDDKRMEDIQTLKDLGAHFIKETTHFWEFYKHLKKPGTGKVEGFFEKEEAMQIVQECEDRYEKEYKPKLGN